MLAEYLDHMGSDLTVVNAARVSFNSESQELKLSDENLIRFLARGCKESEWNDFIQQIVRGVGSVEDAITLLNHIKRMPTHWTPFSHPIISMRETVPIFVARQRFKHMIGFTYNEISRRYVDYEPEIYTPECWRSRPENGIKQGSAGKHEHNQLFLNSYQNKMAVAKDEYEFMIEEKVAPEQARMVLPQSMKTTYWVTGSLYAWANAYNQRIDSHAQKEIQDLAKQWEEVIEPLFPVSWNALTK